MPAKEKSLEELMHLSQQGDKVAYSELLKAVSTPVRAYLFKSINDKAEAEDVLQEVLLSIHKARHTYDSDRPLMPWVMSITKFRLSDYLRKHYRTTAKESYDMEFLESRASTDDVTQSRDSNELLSIALGKLPDKQRKIVHMLKIEGYSVKEIGKEMDMSASAVKVSAHRAYKVLKTELENLGYED